MKKSSLTIAFAVIVFAVGSAFVSQSTEVDKSILASTDKVEIAQIGYYKIPNQPCGQMAVPCSNSSVGDLCTLPIPGKSGVHQFYAEDCATPLRRDQ